MKYLIDAKVLERYRIICADRALRYIMKGNQLMAEYFCGMRHAIYEIMFHQEMIKKKKKGGLR